MNAFVTIFIVLHVYEGFTSATHHHRSRHHSNSSDAITADEIGNLIASLPPAKGNEVYSTLKSLIPFLRSDSKAYSFISSIPNVVQPQARFSPQAMQIEMPAMQSPYFARHGAPMPLFAPNYSPLSQLPQLLQLPQLPQLGAHHHFGAPTSVCYRRHGIFFPKDGIGFGLSVTSFGRPDENGKDGGFSLTDLFGDDGDKENKKNKLNDSATDNDQEIKTEEQSENIAPTDAAKSTEEELSKNTQQVAVPQPSAETVEEANEVADPAQVTPPSTEEITSQQQAEIDASSQTTPAPADAVVESQTASVVQSQDEPTSQQTDDLKKTPSVVTSKPRAVRRKRPVRSPSKRQTTPTSETVSAASDEAVVESALAMQPDSSDSVVGNEAPKPDSAAPVQSEMGSTVSAPTSTRRKVRKPASSSV